jgi:hypothetical protein
MYIMDNNRKAELYGQLLNEHTRLSNQISAIKGESLELNEKQKREIQSLNQRQLFIMKQLESLMR